MSTGDIFISSALHHWSENCKTCLCQKVHYHSGGLKFTPQMSNDGSIYSAVSTGHPLGVSRYNIWLPGVSTMLQLLVSIQGLFFNTKPFFNLPPRPSAYNEKQCQEYNEDVFVLSLRTMTLHYEESTKGKTALIIPIIIYWRNGIK